MENHFNFIVYFSNQTKKRNLSTKILNFISQFIKKKKKKNNEIEIWVHKFFLHSRSIGKWTCLTHSIKRNICYSYPKIEISNTFLYSLRTEIYPLHKKHSKIFLYSLKTEILADFLKQPKNSFIFSQNSIKLYKKSKSSSMFTKTEISKKKFYSINSNCKR